MPKKYSRRSMKGGMFEGLTSGWNSFTDQASSAWKKLTDSNLTPSNTETQSFMPSSSRTSSFTVGGKKRRRKSRKMRGGNFTDNTPTTGLAFHAAPFSGETARPNTWVGGKTRKRRKSCRKR